MAFPFLNSGYIDNQHGFEDSAVTEPLVDDVDGFTRTNTKTCSNSYTCGWDLTPIVPDDYGPSEAASFPYVYSIGAGGSFSGSVQEASLVYLQFLFQNLEFLSSHLRCGCAGTTIISKVTCTAGP